MRTSHRFAGCAAVMGVFLAIMDTPPVSANEVNYDEAMVPAYSLPDPLRMNDGRRVTEPAMWYQQRRGEILDLFERNVYGRVPPRPDAMAFRVEREDAEALNGAAIRRDIVLEMTGVERGDVLSFSVVWPKSAAGPVPVFVGIHLFDTNREFPLPAAARRPNRRTPVDAADNEAAGRAAMTAILDRGYAIASLNVTELSPDSADTYSNGLHRLMGRTDSGPPGPEEFGAIGAWAWGLSRALDYFETATELDHRRTIAIGHSRMGKTALWAGAQDSRFAAVISNNSGCGGAALSRRRFGETIAMITRSFPHWFCGNLLQYADKEDELPVDQHQLIALIAPRLVYIASAEDDGWADPRGEFLAAVEAGRVYDFLHAGGLGADEMPGPDESIGETIGYHVRTGQHDLTDVDWRLYLDFMDRHFKAAQ